MALRLAYDGRFAGYARQPEGGTIEDHVLASLRREGFVEGSWRSGSRTDRGVAAAANVAVCQLERPHLRGLVPAVQARLPEGLWLTGATMVDEAFDPRRASWRVYEYHVPSRGEDAAAMQAACDAFVGTHDLRAFARLDGRSPQRTILQCAVAQVGDWWSFRVGGRAFLWNQVRRMVHAILQVGRGRAGPDDIRRGLATGSPHPSFGIAPPEGLVLREVCYEPALVWQQGPPSRSLGRYAQRARVEARLADLVQGTLDGA